RDDAGLHLRPAPGAGGGARGLRQHPGRAVRRLPRSGGDPRAPAGGVSGVASRPAGARARPRPVRPVQRLCRGAGPAGQAGRPGALRRFALLKLAWIAEQVRPLAEGTVILTSTETWRTASEQLLVSPGLRLYRSVAWAKTAG